MAGRMFGTRMVGTAPMVEDSSTMPLGYEYRAIYRTPEQIPPVATLMCFEVTLGPPRTVLFNLNQRTWVFNRAAGAMYLYDQEKQEQTRLVSRTEAEEIATEILGTRLPSEAELHHMMLAGEAATS